MVAVYECWGDLYFETYDPAGACNMTLQVKVDPPTCSRRPSPSLPPYGLFGDNSNVLVDLGPKHFERTRGGAHTG